MLHQETDNHGQQAFSKYAASDDVAGLVFSQGQAKLVG